MGKDGEKQIYLWSVFVTQLLESRSCSQEPEMTEHRSRFLVLSRAGRLMNKYLPIQDQTWNLRVGNDHLSHFTDEAIEAKMR